MPVDILIGTYCGPAPDPAAIWLRWNLDPVLLAMLAASAYILRRSIGGLLAVAVLALASLSPLCALSAALFSARVVHHVLLIGVAAPLLAMTLPMERSVPAAIAFLPFCIALWIWHLPDAYDLALSNIAVYWLMQGTLLGSTVIFWQSALDRSQAMQGLMLILAGYMQIGLLGAILTFIPNPLYAVHAVVPMAWGLTPLGDQQLGGLIMWVPAGIPFAAFGAWSHKLRCRKCDFFMESRTF
jgi:putative membrane protein